MNETLKKMSLDKYQQIIVLNKPDDISLLETINYQTQLQPHQDCIVVFIETLKEMKELIYLVQEKKLLLDGGYLFFLYPKLNNPKGLTPIHRDDIFPYLNLDMGGDGFVDKTNLKFSRMVKFDENYTCVGLKQFDKIPKPKKEISQRVDDYVQYLDEIKERLQSDPKTLEYFNQLTLGKQKDWARFLYSAQKEETKEKRWNKLYDDANNLK